ncbi:GD15667 [Drosophila simulans]|uniref:GD15667 n=1 Tax=Drosophila simulans TaxID=7240 RepID=B4R6N7_DROSI|nr:GD15667 [Drosophila simulans]
MGNRESNSGARSVVATDNDALDFGHCDDDDDDAVICGGRDSSRHGHMSSTMANRQKWAEISERSDDDELGIVVLVAERFISLNGPVSGPSGPSVQREPLSPPDGPIYPHVARSLDVDVDLDLDVEGSARAAH